MNAELLLMFPIIINKTITQYRFFSFHQLYWVFFSGEGVFKVGNYIFSDVHFNIKLRFCQLLGFLTLYNFLLILPYMSSLMHASLYMHWSSLGFYTHFVWENWHYYDFKYNEFKLSDTLHFLKEQNMASYKTDPPGS